MKRNFFNVFVVVILATFSLYVSPALSKRISSSGAQSFLIAQVPDTQAFFWSNCPGTNASQVTDMYNWIFANHSVKCSPANDQGQGCYQYIFHVGDIVDGNGGDGWMWTRAGETFNEIISANTQRIPFGFATGNHDYTSVNGSAGQGVYSPDHYQDAKKFLGDIYSKQAGYGPQFVEGTTAPFASYKKFTVGSVNFIALNLPFGLPTVADPTKDPEFQAIQTFIKKNNTSLIILNAHMYGSWGSAPFNSNLARLYQDNKNVFMALWGHDPAMVHKNGTFDPILPKVTNRINNMGPVYVYKYDYQEEGPWDCSANQVNMPQHPLIRIYNFTLDGGVLSWKAYDVQAWRANNAVYGAGTPWANNQDAKALIAKGPKVYPLDGGGGSITISQYLPNKLKTNNAPAS